MDGYIFIKIDGFDTFDERTKKIQVKIIWVANERLINRFRSYKLELISSICNY